VSGQAPTEAAKKAALHVSEVLLAIEQSRAAGRTHEAIEYTRNLTDDFVALSVENLAQRDVVARLEQRLMVAWTEDEYFQEIERLRDVVAAACAYLAVPRKVEPDADGILRFDFLPQQEARKKLAEAVAAVVSGTEET
jgi:hypothetical protein